MTLTDITNKSKSKTAAPGALTRVVQVYLAADHSESVADGTEMAEVHVQKNPTPIGTKLCMSVVYSKVFAPVDVDAVHEA